MMLRVGGSATGDADGEGAVGGGPGDAVCDGSVGDAPGVGAAGHPDGEGASGGARGVGAAGNVHGEGVTGDAMVDGSPGDVPTVRVLQVMDVGPRMGRPQWFWERALATPGGGSSWRCWSVGAPVLAVLVAFGVGAAPRHYWQRVPLVLLMVR